MRRRSWRRWASLWGHRRRRGRWGGHGQRSKRHRRMRRLAPALFGVYRRVVFFLVVAFLVGGVSGWTAAQQPPWWHPLALAMVLWPLTWVATFRIARPVRQLAEMAGRLREGRLDERTQLASSDDEVGEVADALRGMADRVVEQLDHQKSLLAAVSHELRSPLARIRVLVELSREGHGPVSLHDDLQAEVEGMDALVADLLAASRIDFDAVAPRHLKAQDVCVRAVEAARAFDTEVRVPNDLEVYADPTLLARAVGVLLDNAVQHGGGEVRLEVEAEDGAVCFSVLDEGPGFSEGEEEQVFQPFWRRPPDGSKRPAGVGLGLALVRQIARAHGGEAGASRRTDGGARVWMRLPANGRD
jgi:two-component system OmpR family sensor kinase